MGFFDKRLASLAKSISKLDKEISDMKFKRDTLVTPAARLAVDGMIRIAEQRRSRLLDEKSALEVEDKRQTEIPGTGGEPVAPGSIPGRKR